jgi:hypothetical protein
MVIVAIDIAERVGAVGRRVPRSAARDARRPGSAIVAAPGAASAVRERWGLAGRMAGRAAARRPCWG